MNHPQLELTLKQLRLSGLATTLGVRLQEASASRLTHAEFLALVLQDELNLRTQRRLATRSRAAGFHQTKTLEDFDWAYNPKIARKDIYELATCQFIREAKCALFVGSPGLGKSHLSQAIGYEAIKQGFSVLRKSIFDLVRDLMADEAVKQKELSLRQYLKPDLLIIEDFAAKHLPQHSGEYLLEIVIRRYEKKSILINSNRPLEEWGKLFQDVPVATAILDRILHHCHIVPFVGKSRRWPGPAPTRRSHGTDASATDTAA
jgi:DNA replication protein DnaC